MRLKSPIEISLLDQNFSLWVIREDSANGFGLSVNSLLNLGVALSGCVAV